MNGRKEGRKKDGRSVCMARDACRLMTRCCRYTIKQNTQSWLGRGRRRNKRRRQPSYGRRCWRKACASSCRTTRWCVRVSWCACVFVCMDALLDHSVDRRWLVQCMHCRPLDEMVGACVKFAPYNQSVDRLSIESISSPPSPLSFGRSRPLTRANAGRRPSCCSSCWCS